MRVLLVVALLGFGCAARAADLPLGNSGVVFEQPQRAAMVWLADNQSGVIVRRYWSPPWHYHHYFPFTGVAPRVGRAENLSAVRPPAKPAQSYRRSWNNNWAFEHSLAVSVQAVGVDASGNQVISGSQDGGQSGDQSKSRSDARHRKHAHGSHTMHMHKSQTRHMGRPS